MVVKPHRGGSRIAPLGLAGSNGDEPRGACASGFCRPPLCGLLACRRVMRVSVLCWRLPVAVKAVGYANAQSHRDGGDHLDCHAANRDLHLESVIGSEPVPVFQQVTRLQYWREMAGRLCKTGRAACAKMLQHGQNDLTGLHCRLPQSLPLALCNRRLALMLRIIR
jgi:hypothetical protein